MKLQLIIEFQVYRKLANIGKHLIISWRWFLSEILPTEIRFHHKFTYLLVFFGPGISYSVGFFRH